MFPCGITGDGRELSRTVPLGMAESVARLELSRTWLGLPVRLNNAGDTRRAAGSHKKV